MAKIKISPAGVIGASAMAEAAKRETGAVASSVGSVRWGIDNRILNRHGIGRDLNNVCGAISQLEKDIQELYSTVNRGAFLYNSTENSILSMSSAMVNMVQGRTGTAYSGLFSGSGAFVAVNGSVESAESVWKRFFEGDLEKKKSVSAWNNGLDEEEDDWHYTGLGAGYSVSAKPEIGSYKDDELSKIKEKKKKKKVDTVYDPKTGEKYDPESFKLPEKQFTVAEVSAKASAEASVFEAKLTGDKEYGEYNVDIKCGTAEAHAGVSAGIYTYDVNGVILAAPAVDAEIGASVSMLSVSADGRLGLGEAHNMLGIYGEGSVDVFKASGEAKAGLSVFNKEGEIDLSAYAEASAEAIALEASGTAGISVLGADVGVTGSVNIGIGAHAKAGMEDGKIKLDVGISIGVGVSVGLEVDVGGMVEAVCGAAESAWNGIKSWFGKN